MKRILTVREEPNLHIVFYQRDVTDGMWTCLRSSRLHVRMAKNLYSSKVNEFAALTTSGGCKPNNVWSDQKHLRAHEHCELSIPWFERGRAGSPRRSASEGVRGFLDESAVPFGGIGFEESDRHGEHRSVREEVTGITDQDAGPSSNRRVGSAAIARIGVPIAGPSRVVAGSQCGHPQPESEASLPSRGFRSILRRRIHHPVGEGQSTQRNAIDAPSGGTGVASPVGFDFGVCCSAGRGFHHVGVDLMWF